MDDLELGIPGVGNIGPGVHFCALYSGPAERDRLLFPFLDEGLRHGDKCLCLIDGLEPSLVRDQAVGQPGPDYSRRSAQLDVRRASDAYLPSGEFRVTDMTQFLSASVDSAREEFTLLRAAGEMTWVLEGPPGREDLFVYESALNGVVDHAPAILMCLYDLKKFGAGMLVDVLRTHPMVLLDRTVIENPHYLSPHDYVPSTVTEADNRTGDLDPGWNTLTAGELRVVAEVARGMSNRGIAENLHLSRHTVDAHLKHVYVKLGIHSRVELTVRALQHNAASR